MVRYSTDVDAMNQPNICMTSVCTKKFGGDSRPDEIITADKIIAAHQMEYVALGSVHNFRHRHVIYCLSSNSVGAGCVVNSFEKMESTDTSGVMHRKGFVLQESALTVL